jgi:hypothetical protein
VSARRPTPAQLKALEAADAGKLFAYSDGAPCAPVPALSIRWDVVRRLVDRGWLGNGVAVDSKRQLYRLVPVDAGRDVLDTARERASR